MNIPKAIFYFKKPLFDHHPQKKDCLRIALRIFPRHFVADDKQDEYGHEL